MKIEKDVNMDKDIHNAESDSNDRAVNSGSQMGNSPFLWRENSPSPYTDSPGEKFVPAPMANFDDVSKTKRILKYIVIGLIAAFVLITFIAICTDAPQTLFRGDTGRGHFFQ